MKANKPLLMQLDVVYQYLLNFKKLSGNLDIIKSLGEDMNAQDMTKWALPNYDSLIKILSAGDKLRRQKALGRLIACFQLLLSSYCCCKLEDPRKFVFDCLLVKFIKKDILPNKTKNSKIIQRFHSKKGSSIKKSKLLRLHCKLLVVIFNLKLKIATSSTEKNNAHIVQFFQMIDDYCIYVESLIHALIAHTSSKGHEKGLAFNQHYIARIKVFPDKYVKDILLIVSESGSQPSQRMKTLKMVIKELLRVLDSVLWPLLNDYARQHKARVSIMARERMHIQAALLIAEDLDLISEFRLISWPSWAIDL
ncbi:hypothetical protein HG536_0C04580 [Torulaspora globosa]|uniref:Uncharacterized protein n=1 Tax=Torulaspora globosa TaxID=48254 RepID=A0A7G3ZFK3_9SACH|nr:uncharacterized protein HG536_0C04580 [Torulaspora globosa]QLL32289.1 hypothetical protein HG536_0C04580 [Torulaspora globosa]